MRHPMFTHEDGNGFRVLLEQASHEIHRGAYDIGLQYLNKALAVSGISQTLLPQSTFFPCDHISSWVV